MASEAVGAFEVCAITAEEVIIADSVMVTGASLVLGWEVSAIMADAVAAHHMDIAVSSEDPLSDNDAPAHSAQQQPQDTVFVMHPKVIVGSPSSSCTAVCDAFVISVVDGFGTQYAAVSSTSSTPSYTLLISSTH